MAGGRSWAPRPQEAADSIRPVVDRLKADPSRFRALNPENGWGNYDGALEAMETIVSLSENYAQAGAMVWRGSL